jgi:hypothetical protein
MFPGMEECASAEDSAESLCDDLPASTRHLGRDTKAHTKEEASTFVTLVRKTVKATPVAFRPVAYQDMTGDLTSFYHGLLAAG